MSSDESLEQVLMGFAGEFRMEDEDDHEAVYLYRTGDEAYKLVYDRRDLRAGAGLRGRRVIPRDRTRELNGNGARQWVGEKLALVFHQPPLPHEDWMREKGGTS